ncbi:16S rRNA (guanine(527)-N(7))-methyltransferase RsmG [Stakelama sp. CBK3Z-3]|uniref:Ribosomal RNA small subunit methyltransferase G n=1 Tax=Stakelama flava TaxID=2860338 RepID=A0ABS6XKI9_9SPHN|nr:16S rRNA (guanine(527)-N(7))-methyltransferase RsmG [Stakelama flava]MBW4330716.1 16S rRNA (guanine(527)-N(7))-methyltransferase RsmG [Stakelama flava]
MKEPAARHWIRERFGVSRETTLEKYADLLVAENERQNLIAKSTIAFLWSRHFVDSAQLIAHGKACNVENATWMDIGSGAGLPGLVLAVLQNNPILLVEPRKKRVEFLSNVVSLLKLDHVKVVHQRVETVQQSADVITARAVASLPQLFEDALHCAHKSTCWVLPKGKSADVEVEEARKTWQGVFHVEHSITDPQSHIVIAREVRPR